MTDIVHRSPPGEIAGKFYWPSTEYSIPADNLCWHIPPAPNRDFRCIRPFDHPGRCEHAWCPTIRDFSHRTAADATFPAAEAILDKAKNEGRDTYRLGLARTLNPYMSTQIRDAWFAGYDDGAAS